MNSSAMSRLASSLCFMLLLAAPGCRGGSESKQQPAELAEDAQLRAEARALSDRLAAALQSELVAAIGQEGGAAHAIEVCQIQAPAIATDLSTDGWVVGRTAPRVRNPANAANEWQRRGLAHFADTIAAAGPNPDLASFEWQEIVERDGGRELHYMRAIPMGGLCLACHGPVEKINPAVLEQLAARYPDDQATGFAAGELRGAFAISKSL
jgi:hypothetical protein